MASEPGAALSPDTPERRKAVGWRRAPAWGVAKRVAKGVYADGFIHAGNIAYLAMVAMFPFFIVVTALAQLFGRSDAGAAAVASMLHVMPRGVADMLGPVIAGVLAARTGPLLWLGALVGLWTVGSFVETIRDILRRAYGTRYSAPFWEYRLWSLLIIVGSVMTMFLAFALQVALTAAEQLVARVRVIRHVLPVAEQLVGWVGITRLVPGAVLFVALYALFWALTPAKYRRTRSRKWPGALLTATWWLAITALLPVVIARASYTLTYGSLAGVIVALLFFWLVGLGLVTGAHLNAALAEPVKSGVREPPE